MPPKCSKPAEKPSKKTEQKKKDKVVEDKTFGIKNKKGAKQQKFIQQVQKQVQFGGNPSARKLELLKKDQLDGKKKKEDDPLDFDNIIKPVTQSQKIEKGADPKSILCAFFKQGKCGKGDKCKFSHDLTIERKAEKRSLYCDMRDDEADTMDQWDEAKLKEVIEKKHGEAERSVPTTDIICKFFLDAVEKSKYGWFWECPSGTNCHYRHALPPGFVLNKDKKKDDKKDEISIEDLVEKERNNLGANLTRVTLETFIGWKRKKIKEKKEANRAEEDKKRADFKAGRQVGISGRDMFTFNPEMAADGEDYEDGDDTFDTRNLPMDDDGEERIEFLEVAFDGYGDEGLEEDMNKLNVGEGASSSVPIDENLFVDDDDDLSDSDSDESID